MSKIEVDAIEPQSGTTLTVGGAGDSVNVIPGAIKDSSGNVIISKSGSTVTIGASGDTVSVASGAEFVGGGISWQSTIVTGTTLSAVAGNGYWINTTSNACTITLPASASAGDQIIFVDYARTWNTNNVTINTNSLNFQGNTSPNPVYNTNGQTVNIVYSGATQGWIPVSDDDVTLETPQSYEIDFLIVAGGGGGGRGDGGGGGAGGYRTSTQEVPIGSTITVTVGDGGAGRTDTGGPGTSGSDSSISGSGLTTITSAGGGGGGSSSVGGAAFNGGSGGGGASGNAAGSGNTPVTSPSQGNDGGAGFPGNAGGGGGGAGAVGQSAPSQTGGGGGAGTASSITGSSVTRAGGGGGRGDNFSGPGGTGGGGDAGSGNAAAGTVNTGGGGGGSATGNGGNGGNGVVILSMPDADYSGTTTGSPTVATGVSGKTVLTFNGSGSYTA